MAQATCPNCGATNTVHLVLDFDDDQQTKALLACLRREIRRRGGDVQRALGSQ